MLERGYVSQPTHSLVLNLISCRGSELVARNDEECQGPCQVRLKDNTESEQGTNPVGIYYRHTLTWVVVLSTLN